MRTFLTSESMILAKAAPMMTPTARSMTLPLKAKFSNSSAREKARLAGADSVTDLSDSMTSFAGRRQRGAVGERADLDFFLTRECFNREPGFWSERLHHLDEACPAALLVLDVDRNVHATHP